MSRFYPGELRVFDHSGAPIGVLDKFSITGPHSYRLNEPEDMQFEVPRNDGSVPLLYDSAAPVVVGVSSTDVDHGVVRLANPTGTTDGMTLVAIIAYDTQQATDHAYVSAPSGWDEVVEHELNLGQEVGVRVFTRVVRPGNPTSRTFRVLARDDDALQAVSAQGVLMALSGVLWDRKVGARIVDLDKSVQPSAGTSHAAYAPPNGVVNPLTVMAWVLSSGHGTISDPPDMDERAEVVGTNQSLYVATRTEVEHDEVSLSAVLTTATGVTGLAVAIMFFPQPGTVQLLERDNFILVGNDQGLPTWAGEIDGVTFHQTGASVRVLGTMNCFASLPTDDISQNEGEASTIAWRLVEAANAWKGSHGDLVIGLSIDGSNPNYGQFEYEGDILRGLQTLLDRTISDAYMESGIDPVTGYLWTTLHWGGEYSIDKTAVTLADGPGGNLAPGTTIDFTGAERVNYGRLLGAETNIRAYLDYDSVLNFTEDIIPETSAIIPAPKMPGARRRASLDLSVDWGLPANRQEKLARTAQAQYLDYYKRFLYAYHERWGMPFLPGFEWTGPESGQFKKMSGRNYRTTNVLASLANREIVTDWDPDDEADVEIEGWYHIEDITNIINPRGIAYDHTEPTQRFIARGNELRTLDAIEPYDTTEVVIGTLVRYTGENLRSIDTSATDPGSIWAASQTSAYTYVRQWDIEAAAPLREWRITLGDTCDIAVNVEAGAVYIVNRGSHTIEKRDINSGILLDSYASEITSGPGLNGVSASGDFLYVLGRQGEIEIWNVGSSPGIAGSFQTSNPEGEQPRGIFVDPSNSQVWLWYEGQLVSLYSAAIAVDSSDGGGPVDGVPGFDQISSGAFVRIVMSHTRDLGEPPEAIRGIKKVLHRNQFGRYVDGVWRSWGTKFDKYNCSFAAHAMLLDRHTYGKDRVPPKRLRWLSGDRSGGSNMKFNAIAWKELGYKLNYTNDGPWSGVIDKLREGRGVVLFGDMDQIPTRYQCQANYGGNHAVYVHKIDGEGRFVVHDPLCRKLKRIPAYWMRRYAGKFKGQMGRAVYSWSRVTSQKTKATDARSHFVVWSEGEYKDIFSPGAPGEPATVTRTWDPKKQKSGFKKESQITLESPEQVILGEEGRVADWVPTEMGYGVNGKHYYQARDGTIMESNGWHLKPWDVPLSEFALGQPDWPEGKAYLARLMNKYNREQGAQVLNVVNVNGVWNDIVLGGVYSIDCSLVGAYQSGITGTVRVITYSPDIHNGQMQVLAEWID